MSVHWSVCLCISSRIESCFPPKSWPLLLAISSTGSRNILCLTGIGYKTGNTVLRVTVLLFITTGIYYYHCLQVVVVVVVGTSGYCRHLRRCWVHAVDARANRHSGVMLPPRLPWATPPLLGTTMVNLQSHYPLSCQLWCGHYWMREGGDVLRHCLTQLNFTHPSFLVQHSRSVTSVVAAGAP